MLDRIVFVAFVFTLLVVPQLVQSWF